MTFVGIVAIGNLAQLTDPFLEQTSYRIGGEILPLVKLVPIDPYVDGLRRVGLEEDLEMRIVLEYTYQLETGFDTALDGFQVSHITRLSLALPLFGNPVGVFAYRNRLCILLASFPSSPRFFLYRIHSRQFFRQSSRIVLGRSFLPHLPNLLQEHVDTRLRDAHLGRDLPL